MKAPSIFAYLTRGGWAVVTLIGLVVIAWLAWTLTEPGRARQRAAEAERAARVATGDQKGAAAAIGTVSNNAAAVAAGAQITQENRDAILNAPGADARVDPALAAAGRNGLCRRAAYRDRPECRVRAPGP